MRMRWQRGLAWATVLLALALAAVIVASWSAREIATQQTEQHRISVAATVEAERLRDVADQRREIVDAHESGVDQGARVTKEGVLIGATLVLSVVVCVLALAGHVALNRSSSSAATWE